MAGDAPGDDLAECDDCRALGHPWNTGVSVAQYSGIARRMVLALKHGDRHDLVGPMAGWMVARLRTPLDPQWIVAPVPIHWRRMLRRRYNQSALLARAISRNAGADFVPDLLRRRSYTRPQEGLTLQERFSLQGGSMTVHPGRQAGIASRPVLLVDDVMTTGATLSAASTALIGAGAARVDVVTFARVVKEF